MRVGLSVAPEAWFTTLNLIGKVLHLTRNAVAVLGQFGSVPALRDWRNPVLPRDPAGSFAPNLAEHARLWAVRKPSLPGPMYGFEVCDVAGHARQHILLTASANHDLFERFVTDHQSPPEEAAAWFPPNHAASAQRRAAMAARIFSRRSRPTGGANPVLSLSASVVPRLFAAAACRTLSVRTTHYTPLLVRSAIWTPQVPEASGPGSDVQFVPGDHTGLHLFLPAMAGVWLSQGRGHGCDRESWTVEIADASDHIALAITAGDRRGQADWRELLREVAIEPKNQL